MLFRSQIQETEGKADRGRQLFQLKCAQCHGGPTALGPALEGVAKRFSVEDLLVAIYDPSRIIPDRYRSLRVLTVDNEVLTGLPIYQASDGVNLQAADGKVYRINASEIAKKMNSEESLMPRGLLEDKSTQDVSDLVAYLRSL